MHFRQTKIKKEDSDHNFCTQAPDVLKTERRVNYTFDLYKVSKLVKIMPPPPLLKKGKFQYEKTQKTIPVQTVITLCTCIYISFIHTRLG